MGSTDRGRRHFAAAAAALAVLAGLLATPAVIQLFEVRMKDIGVNGVIGDADDQSFVIQGVSIP